MTSKYGAAQDAIGSLKHAFDKLKKETGKPADFMYPEYELEREMMGENARLQSQLLEAEDQISALELENTRVRKAMKNQAGLIGEQGFKFQGMDAESLVIVNEFASNLREGKLDLPLNDRSVELLKENRRLKDEQKAMNLRLERYERELSGSVGLTQATDGPKTPLQPAGMSKIQESELFGLRNDVQKLLNENDSLHGRMTSMQAELMYTMRSKVEDKGDGTDNIAAVLLATNEALMREIMELRASSKPTRRDSDSLSEMELPQGFQGSLQSQFQGQSVSYPAGIAGMGTAPRSGRLPPAGGRKPVGGMGGTARGDMGASRGDISRGDQHSDTMFTPGEFSNLYVMNAYMLIFDSAVIFFSHHLFLLFLKSIFLVFAFCLMHNTSSLYINFCFLSFFHPLIPFLFLLIVDQVPGVLTIPQTWLPGPLV